MTQDTTQFTVEYFENGWRFDSEWETLEDATFEADELHNRTGNCQRVLDADGSEIHRTGGKSDF